MKRFLPLRICKIKSVLNYVRNMSAEARDETVKYGVADREVVRKTKLFKDCFRREFFFAKNIVGRGIQYAMWQNWTNVFMDHVLLLRTTEYRLLHRCLMTASKWWFVPVHHTSNARSRTLVSPPLTSESETVSHSQEWTLDGPMALYVDGSYLNLWHLQVFFYLIFKI